jgi:tetratricopeptide (TPR) repeat protein
MEGVELYQKQKYNQASKKFYKAHQEKPNDPKISYNLGNSLYKQGDYEKALQNYSRLIEQKPDSSMNQNTNYNMGNVLFRMNKLEESIVAYKKALELDPSDMDSKFNLEFVREQIKKKKKKQNQDKSKKNKEGQKNSSEKKKKGNDKERQSNKKTKENTPSNKEPPNHKKKQNQNNPAKNTETASGKMTKEEAEQRLSVLTEDLKQFQRKQALEMKSLFTYQGNDW